MLAIIRNACGVNMHFLNVYISEAADYPQQICVGVHLSTNRRMSLHKHACDYTACKHSSLPAGQGLALALEDAVVLAWHLRRQGLSEDALRRYAEAAVLLEGAAIVERLVLLS